MGQGMAGLVCAEQEPEALAFWRPPSRETNTGFGIINGEMHDEIKKRQPPEGRIDGKRNRQRKGCMDRAVHGQRCKPIGSLLLPASHPAVLQNKIGEQLFDFKQNENQDDQPKRQLNSK